MQHNKCPKRRRQAASSKSRLAAPKPGIDQREQLINDGVIGPITTVSLPEANITALRGIMIDLDPKLLDGAVVSKATKSDPVRFFKKIVRPWLQRHPVLAKAQVRNSGTGLHIILVLDQPIEFTGDAERQRWGLIIKVLQRILPSDPSAPGITAMTRPVGSTNSKNGAKVTVIAKGEPVTEEEVRSLFQDMATAPVKTVARVLFGAKQISPCPICRKEGTSLAALDRTAKCYGACGTVKLSQILDLIYIPRAAGKEA